MAFIIQYLYFSDTFNKYFFNTKRKAKEKEYHSIVHRQVILTIDKDPINEIVTGGAGSNPPETKSHEKNNYLPKGELKGVVSPNLNIQKSLKYR